MFVLAATFAVGLLAGPPLALSELPPEPPLELAGRPLEGRPLAGRPFARASPIGLLTGLLTGVLSLARSATSMLPLMAESTEADKARGGETVDGGGTVVVGFGVVFGVVGDNVFKARAQVNSGSGDGVL